MTKKIYTDSNISARGFNFFPPRTLRPMVALGKTTPHANCSTFAIPHEPTHKPLACKRAAILPTHPFFVGTFVLLERFKTKRIEQANTLALIAIHLLIMFFAGIDSFGQIPVVQTPQPASLFQNIQIGNTYGDNNKVTSDIFYPNYSGIDPKIHEQNMRLIEEANNWTKANMEAELRLRQLTEYNYQIGLIKYVKTNYRNAFDKIKSMLEGNTKMSLKQAVFEVEHAFNNTFTYEQYDSAIQRYAEIVKLKMAHDKSGANNPTINIAIAQVLSDTITIKLKYNEQEITSYPLSYDFDDGWGEKDWNKMFVSKLLFTGKGQCHSMPLLHLIIAEELNANAYLSLSPSHSFIKFENNNTLYNLETTHGVLVTDQWVMASGYINTESIKNKVFLDTLNTKQVIADCLNDLASGYTKVFGYRDTTFIFACTNLSLKYHDKGNAIAHVIKNNSYLANISMMGQQLNIPKLEDALKIPDINKLWQLHDVEYQYLKSSGYKNIPKDEYDAWLQTARTDSPKQIKKQNTN
jgi:hypothetical protein